MTRRITYKEISIALGILVAVIILVFFWLNPADPNLSGTGALTPVEPSVPATRIFIQQLVSVLQASFR